ncbi:hypothetical protein Psal006b_03562 (plasmid) [Piscirickettsia salmonis]|uniref:Phosphoglycerate kinase n=1 Tax=Piscirickettsia salmonis TaxID=1238 RepID=A0A1L6TIA9_PISSA|nr:hypothetical protein [Piscirickettsia salmonis]ALB24388.1 phosphoglycerate kinase [Piscirickettsia salmonis]ALT18982.1 hypothetical protein PSLF89_09110 [Piscirickettsia salmonis LF-89 = ATCC VR-1361]ALY04358.1 hypothetical protein AWE47_17495 [Piscirickettsia salmonis]AMA44046.1 hypothetical protein AWJ11_16840 [Piscirickettsia salmonis]AMA44105.1 hypothetical protein AWJ11_17160 [Piscirickettsia salmonis]
MKHYLAGWIKNNLNFSKTLLSLLDIFIGISFVIFILAYSGITLLTTFSSVFIAIIFIYKAKHHAVIAGKKGLSLKSSAQLQIRTILTVIMAIIPVLAISHLVGQLF